MNVPLTLFLLLLLACIVGAGEFAWFAIILGGGVYAAFEGGELWRRFMVPILACVIVVLHLKGYKLYGSPVLHDNRPLMASAHRMMALEPPATVLCEDGSRLVLKDTILHADASMLFTPELIRFMFGRTRTDPVMVGPGDGGSGVVVQRRIQYWCGNTWVPTWFPERLPAYRMQDLGAALTNYSSVSPSSARLRE